MSENTWPQKLEAAVCELVGREAAVTVVAGVHEASDERSRASWAGGAIRRVEQLVPEESRRWEIMSRCSCTCSDQLIAGHRERWLQHGDVDVLLAGMYPIPFRVRPERRGRTIVVTKAPCNQAGLDAAGKAHERRYHYCHCDYARAAQGPIPSTHCFCGGGWYRRLFEGILGQPVRMELLKSVMRGDEVCQFAAHLPESIRE